MQNDINHPVWDVYNEFRTARLNVLCYSRQLGLLTWTNTIIEIIIAIFTSSAVASFWFWNTNMGQYVWKISGVISVVLAIIKPILNLTDKIIKKSEIAAAYRELDQDFLNLKIKINQEQKYDSASKKIFYTLLKKKSDIVNKYKNDGGSPGKRLVNKCFEQVQKELPANNFYIPEVEENDEQ